jgi:hypothetical protein
VYYCRILISLISCIVNPISNGILRSKKNSNINSLVAIVATRCDRACKGCHTTTWCTFRHLSDIRSVEAPSMQEALIHVIRSSRLETWRFVPCVSDHHIAESRRSSTGRECDTLGVPGSANNGLESSTPHQRAEANYKCGIEKTATSDRQQM